MRFLILLLCFLGVLVVWLLYVGGRATVADWGGPILNRLDGLNRLFCRRVHGLQKETFALPMRGGAVIVSNHISGLDPVLLQGASPRPLRFLIAKREYDRWWLRCFLKRIGCIPVNRRKNPGRSLFRARTALNNNEVIVVFPQGHIVPTGAPPVRLKRGAVFLADLAKVPIVPIRVEGVGADGTTFRALFAPSKVRLTVAPLLPETMDSDARLAAVERFINGTN